MAAFNPESLDLAAMFIREALSFLASGPSASCVDPDDEALVDRIGAIGKETGKPFFLAALDAKITCTPGVWLIYLAIITHRWADSAVRAQLDAIALFRENIPRAGGKKQNELVDGVIEALLALQSARDVVPPEITLRTILARLLRCAGAVEQCEAPEQAYDIAAGALFLAPAVGPEVEELARFACSNAVHAGRYHQVAFAKAAFAVAAAGAALEAPQRRLEAFDAAEETIEALFLVSPPLRPRCVHDKFWPTLRSNQYLRSLLVPLACAVEPPSGHDNYAALLGQTPWPERFSATLTPDWIEAVRTGQAATWGLKIDDQRFALDTRRLMSAASTDWLALTVEHNAYRGAVPHNQSFLREAEFDANVLVLSHEIAHVYSFLGAAGYALTALRIASIKNELRLRLQHAEEDTNNVLALAGAGIRLEIIAKCQSIQNIWTAWMEGLAVFAETAGDPTRDQNTISPIVAALRGLADVDPEGETAAARQKVVEDQHSAFESRWHAAIQNTGPDRLSMYLRLADSVPYFGGYLAVRSIVSSWRETLGERLPGAAAVRLLLHATRFGAFDAIPDLSLPSTEFDAAAATRHRQWVKSLARLSRQDLELFFSPMQANESAIPLEWADGRLQLVLDEEQALAEMNRHITRMLAQGGRQQLTMLRALPEILAAEDAKDRGAEHDSNMELFDLLLFSSGLLPIGRTAARFFVAADPDGSDRLALLIRTTEKLARTGESSTNGLIVPLSRESAAKLKAEYLRTLSPRIRVTRIIDVFGQVGDNRGLSGELHLLVLDCGQWLHVLGATPFADHYLEQDPQRAAKIRDFLKFRIQPTAAERAGLELLSLGKEIAEQTHAWVDRIGTWQMAGATFDLTTAVNYIRTRCRELEYADPGASMRAEARKLLGALWSDAESVEQADKGFERLTQRMPGRRTDLVNWLFRSAQEPESPAAQSELAAALEKLGSGMFQRKSYGYDVRTVG